MRAGREIRAVTNLVIVSEEILILCKVDEEIMAVGAHGYIDVNCVAIGRPLITNRRYNRPDYFIFVH